jgi:hypothetical protein
MLTKLNVAAAKPEQHGDVRGDGLMVLAIDFPRRLRLSEGGNAGPVVTVSAVVSTAAAR